MGLNNYLVVGGEGKVCQCWNLSCSSFTHLDVPARAILSSSAAFKREALSIAGLSNDSMNDVIVACHTGHPACSGIRRCKMNLFDCGVMP